MFYKIEFSLIWFAVMNQMIYKSTFVKYVTTIVKSFFISF